ncbi:MAG: hypothetical protein LQ342_004015 [Letrouitia transgressa]|nr:MAG: hypothetical protein LQ342_004015 [Letrouitia transgressa]
MSKISNLSPYARPPASIKTTYKFYQKLTLEALKTNPNIIDFQSSPEDLQHHRLKQISSVSCDLINSQCAEFDGDFAKANHVTNNDVPVYEHADLPGSQYDWTRKLYPADNTPQFPGSLAKLTTSFFPNLQPEAAIVNVYTPGDTLGIHRDVSEESDNGLVSVSLGCDGVFLAGLEFLDGSIKHVVVRLRSGDAVYMSGKARFAWHGIPQILSWNELAKVKRESIAKAIPQEWRIEIIPSSEEQRDVTGHYIHQYLSPKEIEITESDALDIVGKTSIGTWSAEEVTRAFCHRASLAHQLVGCLHEIFFDAAIQDAKSLDSYLAEHQVPLGPLHGLPVSLKDQFHVKGVETTMGYVGWIGTFQGKKGTGYTWNPKNRNLSSGGSSGGEGAVIALKGSPIGLGTDIGGSVRIPAAFNGLYSLRPSCGRLPYEGMANSMDGQNSVLSVVGPISHSVRSLQLLVKSLLSQEPWLHDPLVHEIPWREGKATLPDKEKLAFGILRHDGAVTPHPPVRRAIELVVKALRKQGHKVIDWTPPSHARGNEIIVETWQYDGGADIHSALALSGEPIAPQVAQLYGSQAREERSATYIAANNVAQREFQKEYMDYWNSTGDLTGTGRPVDAVIAPCAPFAVARPNTYIYYGYSMIVNLLDYSACTLPVTTADQEVDVADEGFEPVSDLDKKVAEYCKPNLWS